MNRIRLIVLGVVILFVGSAVAWQAAEHHADYGAAPVEAHLKMLSEKLGLSAEQEKKVRPIMQEMHDATVKAKDDQSLSSEERLGKMREARERADKKIRVVLTEEQKKKLDELEHQPHPEMHEGGNGKQ